MSPTSTRFQLSEDETVFELDDAEPRKLPLLETDSQRLPPAVAVSQAIAALVFGVLLAASAFFFKRFFFTAIVACILLAAGCTSSQLAADKAMAYNALSNLEAGIDWAKAHPDMITAVLDQAAAAAPDNVTLQHGVALAKAASAAGHRDEAVAIISATKRVLAPPGVAPVGSGK